MKSQAGRTYGRQKSCWRLPLTAGLSVLALLAVPQTPALAASAGLKPSEAPLITVGSHYFGNTHHASNDVERGPVDLWRLPPLLTSDAVTIAWNASGGAPELCLAQNVDDYSWAEDANICNGSGRFDVSGGGSARSVIEANSATSSPFLEFWGDYCCSSQPYDFTIESIQHAIGVDLSPRTYIRTSAVLSAHASLSNGLPMPDGSTFFLNATWGSTGSVQYSATSSGGNLSFPVALPPETIGQSVTFTVTRPADPQYLAAKSAGLQVKIARPKPKVVTPPRHHQPRHCRRGFRKRKVHGQIRCVRKHRHHRH